MDAIRIEGLTKKFGDFTAVDNISFCVGEGNFIGFLGVNGAGKSTTINMMSTLLAPTGGSIEICGYSLQHSNKIRKSIGIVYQSNVLDDLLTVKENLICRGMLHGISKNEAKKRIAELGRIFGLDDLLDRKYKVLSGGQKRKCEIAAALMHTPKILFLDEPTTGLDPAARIEVWNTISILRKSTDMTVFLTTHYMEEAEKADKIIIIDKGRIIAQGTPGMLKKQYASDYLKLYCNENQISIIQKELEKSNYDFTQESFGFRITLNSVFDSMSVINDLREKIISFEVIQGNMDDVFLNATKEVK